MLAHLIKKLICKIWLRGVSGVGAVDRGTVEEKIWIELGALPGSRRHSQREAVDEAASDQVE